MHFKYYLNFHGARTAFGRVIKGGNDIGRDRTVPGRRLAGVCTHRYFFKNLLTNHLGTGRCFISRTATDEKRRVFAEVHIASTL